MLKVAFEAVLDVLNILDVALEALVKKDTHLTLNGSHIKLEKHPPQS